MACLFSVLNYVFLCKSGEKLGFRARVTKLGVSVLCEYAIAALFSCVSANCAYCIFFRINWHFDGNFNIICVSITYFY